MTLKKAQCAALPLSRLQLKRLYGEPHTLPPANTTGVSASWVAGRHSAVEREATFSSSSLRLLALMFNVLNRNGVSH